MNRFRLSPVKLAAVIILAFIFYSSVSAQTYVDVAPGFSTLNDAVKNNTDPNVIFRLQRGSGAIYLLNGSISITVPTRIEAAVGTEALPQLYPGLVSGGTTDIPFRLKANLTLKNVRVSSKDEGGAYLSQIIRIQADNIRLVVDNCMLENSGQSAIRTDNKNSKIYLTNTSVRNCASDWANGRGIDDRGVDMDTLYIQNCTFNNLGSRVLRDGGGVLNYAFLNHNTFVNLGLAVMQFGECPKIIFRNNLVVNCGFVGQLKSATGANLSTKPLTSAVYQGLTQTAQIDHNNFFLDPELVKLYPDSVTSILNYDENTAALVTANGQESTNISEAIAFAAAPPVINSLVTAFWNDPAMSSSTTAQVLRDATEDYSFKYPTTAVSYTAGTGNQPIGALTWFGMTVGVNEKAEMPKGYLLSQNYPNPFNPTTKIRYQLASPANVRLEVFNSMGQKISTLVNDFKAAGQHEVSWNGRNSAGANVSSGIYFYKITTENFTQTKQMIFIK